jgi:hypothetical protein
MSENNFTEFKKFIPGFTMGIVRSIISHPFEMLKLKTQMGQHTNMFKNLFSGIHLSVLSTSIERGIQFYYFDKFKKTHSTIVSSLYSSLISTSISLPYNVVLLKKNILKSDCNISKQTLIKSGSLEYVRNFSGSTIFLYTYDTFKQKDIPFQISGVLSSIIVWSLTYPIDNIKNQIIANKKVVFSPLFLYRGIQYPIMRSFPSAITGLYVYENLNDYLNK